MGANASSYPHSCSPRFGGNSQTQQTFIGTSLYSQQGYTWEPKLYSLEHSVHERPHDRKKKSSGLATLKRRFIRRRRAGRSADHARQMRELLSGWDVRDVNALVEEYEGTAALKELSLAAGLARPEVSALRSDMAALFQHKHCTDVDLVFQDTCFPSHRAILAARCPFFKTLLSSTGAAASGYGGTEVLLDVGTAGMDVALFSALLHFLYTGELGTGGVGEAETRLRNMDVLRQLSEEFGMPNPLEDDMRALFNNMCYYDSVLSFCSDPEVAEACDGVGGISGGGITGGNTVNSSTGSGGQSPSPEEDLRAHKAVLSARSPFFRNLLQRRIRTGEEITERTLQTPTLIVLDESIIPQKYARVILHCMYTDAVDLSLVLHGSPSVGSLSEAQALLTGSGAGKGALSSRTEEAMELYHIALFLEFSMLAQGCEDIIVESISLESLISILKWSSQPYGSKWVHRQAMHFLCEEFSQIMTSEVLYELTKDQLLAAIQSDYLQASEQDILKYVIKWGEHQLIRRMADREPNLLSGTAHSVNKRGVKRRDLDVEELKEILSPLLPYVRMEHILPANSDVLADAMKRGLISTPPSDMLPTAEGGKVNAWLRQRNTGIYVRPRLFSPYVEEAKSVLEELMVEQTDLVRLRMVRMSNVPDTLYMVNNAVPQCCHIINHQQITGNLTAAPSIVANEIPVPRLAVVREMIARLQELRHTDQVQRAYALNCGEGATVSYELQLRVLREFGLPDGAAELLQNPHKFFPEERFGDESPLLSLRMAGRCRVNSSPAMETIFTDLETLGGLNPPLPPPPPPYHPPTLPTQAQHRGGWRPRVPVPPPSRSFSYPCNHTLLQHRSSILPKPSSHAYQPPDYSAAQSIGKTLPAESCGSLEPLISDYMPDIALGVSAMTLSEHSEPQDLTLHPCPRPTLTSTIPHYPTGPCPSGRHSLTHLPCKRHPPKPKTEPQSEYPDLYDFSSQPDTPTSSHPPQATYKVSDLYSHRRGTFNSLHLSYLPDTSLSAHSQGRLGQPADSLHLDVLGQRLDLAQTSSGGPSLGGALVPSGCSINDSDLTCGLGPSRVGAGPYEEHTPVADGTGSMRETSGGVHHRASGEEAGISQDHRSPSTPEYQYKKSAL
ncbi:BTB/POZ domain-containing protein 7-like isoform X1 [Pygocentrus nattereri]|uniref:BTB domain-containing protein n=1 Tax=Pygocentrus nattereri TaxID=42514 RepID=A0A3B4BWT1_PYGNA|nr:BTB/POZ domain-containing protein 7-like isoform X1 [Pygocentrus nattereri]XP_037397778.1 BTB/POZ domain-containing protein 7-like isoform X1 [Pygocentrus nattereri]